VTKNATEAVQEALKQSRKDPEGRPAPGERLELGGQYTQRALTELVLGAAQLDVPSRLWPAPLHSRQPGTASLSFEALDRLQKIKVYGTEYQSYVKESGDGTVAQTASVSVAPSMGWAVLVCTLAVIVILIVLSAWFIGFVVPHERYMHKINP